MIAFAICASHAMRADFMGLPSELNCLRSEFNDLRTEVRWDIAVQREEMRRGFAELRAGIARIERAPR